MCLQKIQWSCLNDELNLTLYVEDLLSSLVVIKTEKHISLIQLLLYRCCSQLSYISRKVILLNLHFLLSVFLFMERDPRLPWLLFWEVRCSTGLLHSSYREYQSLNFYFPASGNSECSYIDCFILITYSRTGWLRAGDKMQWTASYRMI